MKLNKYIIYTMSLTLLISVANIWAESSAEKTQTDHQNQEQVHYYEPVRTHFKSKKVTRAEIKEVFGIGLPANFNLTEKLLRHNSTASLKKNVCVITQTDTSDEALKKSAVYLQEKPWAEENSMFKAHPTYAFNFTYVLAYNSDLDKYGVIEYFTRGYVVGRGPFGRYNLKERAKNTWSRAISIRGLQDSLEKAEHCGL